MLKEYKVVPHCRAMFTDHTHMKWIEWQKKISVWYRCAVLMCARRVCSRMQFELNRNDLYGRMLTTAMDSLFSVIFCCFHCAEHHGDYGGRGSFVLNALFWILKQNYNFKIFLFLTRSTPYPWEFKKKL